MNITPPVTISFAALGGGGAGANPLNGLAGQAANAAGLGDAAGAIQGAIQQGAAGSGGSTIVFPYTPRITQTIEVMYSTWDLQHTNYQPSAFGHRATPVITIDAKFSSRNTQEATATLAAIHLLRSATSMYYGRGDSKKGTPPPVGRFTAHGLYNKTPVVIKSFTYNYPDDMDYVTAAGPGGVQQSVPVLMDMTISMIAQFAPVTVVKEYTLDAFAAGSLLSKGYI
jgi:hypothetical protein